MTNPYSGDAVVAFRIMAARRVTSTPSGFHQDIDDRAVTYLAERLVGSSAPAPFAVHDALRDARKQRLRAKRRDTQLKGTLSAAQSDRRRDGQPQYGPGLPRLASPSFPDPADSVLVADLASRIRESVGQLGAFAAECLDGMLRQDSVAEIAVTTGRSLRSVERMRARIRTMARAIVVADAA